MKTAGGSFSNLSTVIFSLVTLVALGAPVCGQESTALAVGNVRISGLVDDWTHHRVVFSNPGTADEAMRNGTYEQWLKITTNPRYIMHQLRRGLPAQGPTAEAVQMIQDQAASNLRMRPEPIPPPSDGKSKKLPIKKDWQVNLGNGTAASLVGTVVAPVNGTNISGSSTLTIDSVPFAASAPVAQVDTISVPSSAYCIPPGTGVTVQGVNVTTNGTVPTGGTMTTGSESLLSQSTVTIGGVVYSFETSLATTGCGTTLNCVLMSSSNNSTAHNNDASSLNAAINAGAQCSWANPCYSLATGQGANNVASSTVSSDVVSLTWKCAGTASLYQMSETHNGPTLAQPTGGTNGTTSATNHTFAIPSPASNTTLSSNIKTAMGTVTGATVGGTSPNITLTATTPGSTGITAALDGTPTGITVAVTTNGSNGTASATTFPYWSGALPVSANQLAINIAAAINLNGTTSPVVTAYPNVPSSGNITFAADTAGLAGNSYAVSASAFGAYSGTGNLAGGAVATVQPNAYPAKYGASLTSADCSNDYVVYPTGLAGASGAASLIAYNNLYGTATTGCGLTSGGIVPTVYWAYNTGGMVTTSPVLSEDGTQVAFMQASGTRASLVLVKWATGTGQSMTAPVTPTNSASGSAYHSCSPTAVAPCMYIMTFANAATDTFSSPFYDYASDNVYVGDDSGNLHKFTNVFLGSPAESGNPWVTSTTLGSGGKLTSPTLDYNTQNLFVGDMGGFLHSVYTPTGAKVGTSPQIGDSIVDAPVVDSSAGLVYVFVTTGVGSYYPGSNVVHQFSTGFTSAPNGFVYVGNGLYTGGTGYYLYDGIFDNVYYSSSNHTGNLYVIANTGVTTGAGLYRIPITASSMGTAVNALGGTTTLTTSGAYPFPSPMNEFCNNGSSGCVSNGTATTTGTDYLFFSVNQGKETNCTTTAGNGCVLSYNISNPASVSFVGAQNYITPSTGCWATGGLIIDNSSTVSGGGSEIYFVGLNGVPAGGPIGTSSPDGKCTAISNGPTMYATQASQANP